MLRHISPLPKKPSYYMTQYGVNYNPEWPIRVNVEHILGDAENLSRIPPEIREAQNLPLLLETAVELARRKAVVEPSIVVPQGYQGRVQYLLPILSDRYGAARPCHDPHDHGRVLFGEYLPHLRDGVPQRAASFQTGGALAHGHCGGIAAHRSQARSPAAGSALAERGALDLRRSKKEVEQYELTDERKPILCPKCGRRFMDSAPDTKSRLIIPKKGRYPDYYCEVRALRRRNRGNKN